MLALVMTVPGFVQGRKLTFVLSLLRHILRSVEGSLGSSLPRSVNFSARGNGVHVTVSGPVMGFT